MSLFLLLQWFIFSLHKGAFGGYMGLLHQAFLMSWMIWVEQLHGRICEHDAYAESEPIARSWVIQRARIGFFYCLNGFGHVSKMTWRPYLLIFVSSCSCTCHEPCEGFYIATCQYPFQEGSQSGKEARMALMSMMWQGRKNANHVCR